MKKVFVKFDDDKSGELDEVEMKKAFVILGLTATPEEIKKVILEVDEDFNGTINFKEFCEIFKILTAEKIKPVIGK